MTVLAEGRKLRLAFHYEKILEDDCVNRTTRNSNENATEYWQVWLVNNAFHSFGGNQFIIGFSALIQASFENQVKVLCRFRRTNSPGIETLYGELSSPNIIRLTVRSLGEVCEHKQRMMHKFVSKSVNLTITLNGRTSFWNAYSTLLSLL